MNFTAEQQKYINEVKLVTSILSSEFFFPLYKVINGGSIFVTEQICQIANELVDEHQSWLITDWEAYAEKQGEKFYNTFSCWDDFVIAKGREKILELCNKHNCDIQEFEKYENHQQECFFNIK